MSDAEIRLDEDNPWPGLASYDEQATAYFHGRSVGSAELRRLIKRSTFVTLYGKSGLGKSSLLQAGVFPALREERFLPVYLRLDYSEGAQVPLLDQAALRLAEVAAQWHADAATPEPGEGLWAYLQRQDTPLWTTDNYPLVPVLVFDQFEELFSRGGSPGHVQQVLDNLADLVGNRLPEALADNRDAARKLNLRQQQYHVVLSFRSDFLAEVESWAKRASLPRRETMHLTAMSSDHAVEAVRTAGKKVLAPGVAERIVDFLLRREGSQAGQPGGSPTSQAVDVEPVLLSLCCYQLNVSRQRAGQARIDAALVDSAAEGILKNFYDDALQAIPEAARSRVAGFIEDNLILGERYRNAYPLAAALEPGKLDPGELDLLIRNRLLRVDPQGNEPRVELIHDRIVGVVREARDSRRARLAQQQEREAAAQKARQEREAAAQKAQQELERVQREREAAEQKAQQDIERVQSERKAAEQARQVEIERERSEHAEHARQLEEAQRKKAERSLRNVSLALGAAVVATSFAVYFGLQSRDKARAVQDAYDEMSDLVVKQVDQAKAAARQVIQEAADPKRNEADIRQATTKGNVLRISDWRLNSGGCNRGDVTLTGEAVFTVQMSEDAVSIALAITPKGKDFGVKLKSDLQKLPRARRSGASESYDIDTEAEWSGRGQTFTTRSVERVFVNPQGQPVKAFLIRIRTQCTS